MTPTWVTLMVALLGFIGTLTAGLGGVIITQRAADRREEADRRESTERAVASARADERARSYEERRVLYLDLAEHVHALADVSPGQRDERSQLAFAWMEQAWPRLWIYATEDIENLATELHILANAVVAASEPSNAIHRDRWRASELRTQIIRHIRADLGVVDSASASA